VVAEIIARCLRAKYPVVPHFLKRILDTFADIGWGRYGNGGSKMTMYRRGIGPLILTVPLFVMEEYRREVPGAVEPFSPAAPGPPPAQG
jgi:hypothetical protein